MNYPLNDPRILAAISLFQVLEEGRSLSSCFDDAHELSEQNVSLYKAINYGVLRNLTSLNFFAEQLLESPLKPDLKIYQYFILVGLFQLRYLSIAPHAVINETVKSVKNYKANAPSKLINAILRSYQRQESNLNAAMLEIKNLNLNHPKWLIKQIQRNYPDHCDDIFTQNQLQAPMWIRVNLNKISRLDYQALLDEAEFDYTLHPENDCGICLEKPCPVWQLPFFEDGYCSVQDGGAQLSAHYLLNDLSNEKNDGERILDACSAPGGKTCHILERQPNTKLTAVELDANRLLRIHENLNRLGFSANVIQGDATSDDWWDGQLFDKILLDVPCSATGVIRRHPDIKWLRKASDIDALVEVQAQTLQASWKKLKPNGYLLYATCSILPQENSLQIAHFLAENKDACLQPLTGYQLKKDEVGRQILPGENQMDGFYYALLKKDNSNS